MERNQLLNKIAFFRKHEVWIVYEDGTGLQQFTHSGGKVLDFLFSPSLRYFAYFYITGYTDSWDDDQEEGDKAAKIPVYSMIIMDLKNQKILKSIPSHGGIHIDTWLPDDRLVLNTSSAGAMIDTEVYDPQSNVVKKIDYQEWERLTQQDFDINGTVMVYISQDTKTHIVDLKTKEDKIIYAEKKIPLWKISNNKLYLAGIDKKGKIGIYNVKSRKLQTWNADINDWYNTYLQWSFDDRYLMAFTQGQALVLDAQSPQSIIKIKGYNFTWMPNNQILIEDGGEFSDLFIYNLTTRRKTMFLKDASYAQCCGRNEKIFTHE